MPALPTGNEIKRMYENLKNQFRRDPVSSDITNRFIEIGVRCAALTGTMEQIPLGATSTSRGKNYVVFSPQNGRQSRPINIDLYNEGLALDNNGNSKVEVFWHNVLNQTIANQPAEDITTALYVIAMDYFICSDTVNGVGSNYSKYFEMLIGHLYARHLNLNPSNQLSAVELDGESISLPTDFIFDLGAGRPKLHIPVKTSTRERCVEVWAQQRILDGAFGVGRFFCLLTCVGEQNRAENDTVAITCVPNQWINYQLFISQILRAYYLDVPEQYRRLNDRFPKIHVKEYGEFFHEFDHLFD